MLILARASWGFLLTPMLVGASAIVVIALGFHRLVTGKAYPSPP